MIRIGILGSDNSHVESFSKCFNIKGPDQIKGARVVALFGLEKKRTLEAAEGGNIPTIVKRPQDMIGMVDAVIVVFRHGNLHYKYAAPFIQAGIPTFIDKPMTCSVPQAKKLIALARRRKTPITSFSAVRYSPLIEELKKNMKTVGKIRAGVFCARGSSRSPYGGLFFYGIHSVEMMLEIFGNAVHSVRTTEHNGCAVVTIAYKKGFAVTFNILDKSRVPFLGGVFGSKGNIFPDKELFAGYLPAMKRFLNMVKTGKPPIPYKDMLLSVRILDAMEKSMAKDGKEIVIKQ